MARESVSLRGRVGAGPRVGAVAGPVGGVEGVEALERLRREAQIREWSASPVAVSPEARASPIDEAEGVADGVTGAATREWEEAAQAAGGCVGLSSPPRRACGRWQA